jgi:hypothetical protein
MMNSDAQRDRVQHVVIERTSLRRTLNVLNTYAQRAAKRVTIARTVQLANVKHAVFLGTYRTIARFNIGLVTPMRQTYPTAYFWSLAVSGRHLAGETLRMSTLSVSRIQFQ